MITFGTELCSSGGFCAIGGNWKYPVLIEWEIASGSEWRTVCSAAVVSIERAILLSIERVDSSYCCGYLRDNTFGQQGRGALGPRAKHDKIFPSVGGGESRHL